MKKEDIVELIKKDKWMMNVLNIVKTLNLQDWYIGAGFVRGKVWDMLHDYSKRTPLPDIDVIYLNKNDFTDKEIAKDSTKTEIFYQNKLKTLMSDVNWSVTNQARMHVFHKDKPYKSSEEALSQWVETATCVGVRLDEKNNLVLSAPRGIDDLVNLILKPTPKFKKNKGTFYKRMTDKDWLRKWPKLRVVV